MEERMTVAQAIALLSIGSRWRLVGARTGKTLCKSSNKEKTKAKYMDKKVTDHPFVADFEAYGKMMFTDFIHPMISIWVSGE